MVKQIKPAVGILMTFIIITGILYPLFVTGLAQAFFPYRANGSLIIRDGRTIGSQLIGQQFDTPEYFWGRPSASNGEPYNASASGGSNYSVLNPDLRKRVKARLEALQQSSPENQYPVPVDLVTASASGLDPHISAEAADWQAERVAKARRLPIEEVKALIREHSGRPMLGILGKKTVNVLELNLALDGIK